LQQAMPVRTATLETGLLAVMQDIAPLCFARSVEVSPGAIYRGGADALYSQRRRAYIAEQVVSPLRVSYTCGEAAP
jgi:hypothetical protein